MQVAGAVIEDGDHRSPFVEGSWSLRRASLEQAYFMARAKHIEVQVFGDGSSFIHMGDRDCSMQRRRQKVIEEAPAPGLDGELRRTLAESAADAARAIGYEGAGTVEFLVSSAGRAQC